MRNFGPSGFFELGFKSVPGSPIVTALKPTEYIKTFFKKCLFRCNKCTCMERA